MRVKSAGFGVADAVVLEGLAPLAMERETSAALVRGVAAGFAQRGVTLGGLDIYTSSDVLKGSGLSSSAAFEVCLAEVLNCIYNESRFSPIELAQIGQYAENEYFGKPSGLMDQLACAVGGAICIDFADPEAPKVEQVAFDLSALGYALVITDTGGSHADMTADYAAIRGEMEAVAKAFGKPLLRQVDEAAFIKALPGLRGKLGDRALLRALHFFAECHRVPKLTEAIAQKDMPRFLSLLTLGGHSSFEYNQNAYRAEAPKEQGLPLALALSQRLLEGTGGWRLQGGGFAGTIQAFVPLAMLAEYTELLGGVFGREACHVLGLRRVGCCQIGLW